MSGHIKIVGAVWYSGIDTIGIVKVHDTIMGKDKYYMGVCVDGNTPEQDAQYIADFGCSVEEEIGSAIFYFRG